MNKPYSEFPDVLIDPSRFRDRIAALLHDKTTINIRAGDFLVFFGGSRSYVSGNKLKQYRHYHTTMNGIEITACDLVEGDE